MKKPPVSRRSLPRALSAPSGIASRAGDYLPWFGLTPWLAFLLFQESLRLLAFLPPAIGITSFTSAPKDTSALSLLLAPAPSPPNPPATPAPPRPAPPVRPTCSPA